MQKRAIIYTRVSSEGQGDNFSLPTQLAACRKYAASQGMDVVAECADIMSGSLLDRPGLTKVRQAVSVGAVDAVIVYSQDRLTRNAAHFWLVRDELRAAHVAMHAVSRGQSEESPEGQLFDGMEAIIAEYERLKIRERTQRGKRGKVESGAFLGTHTAPYGYRFEGQGRARRLVVNEAEAAVVRQVFGWYVDRVTVHAIVRRLNAADVPTASASRPVMEKAYGGKASGRWLRATIYPILRQRAYMGVVSYPQYDGLRVQVPAIVDRAVWDVVQARLDVGKAQAPRNTKRFFLLRTRLRCACGGTMHGMHNLVKGRSYRYYTCAARATDALTPCPFRGKGSNGMGSNTKADPLEALVWNWIVTEVLIEEHIIAALAAQGEQTDDRRAALAAEQATYQRQMESFNAQVTKLVKLFSADVLSLEEVGIQKKAIDSTRASVRAELDRVALELQQTTGADAADATAVLALAAEVRAMLADGDDNDLKAQVVDLLDLKAVMVRDDAGKVVGVDVRCCLTLDDARLPIESVSIRANSQGTTDFGLDLTLHIEG